MANSKIQNIDRGSLELGDAVYRDELLTFGGADTLLAGTLLARHSTSGKLIPYVKTDTPTNGNNVPKAVLPYEVSATAAGDVPIRALVAGKVKRERLVVDADGDDSSLTDAILDELRDFGIVAIDTQQLSQLDNQ